MIKMYVYVYDSHIYNDGYLVPVWTHIWVPYFIVLHTYLAYLRLGS